mmetsp:Transcript_28985/g.69403  ORF Transcript_28985/g.69403 Transcript_28985/m.69403 type:complete len:249 (-) Transcript_28985:30-776(-)
MCCSCAESPPSQTPSTGAKQAGSGMAGSHAPLCVAAARAGMLWSARSAASRLLRQCRRTSSIAAAARDGGALGAGRRVGALLGAETPGSVSKSEAAACCPAGGCGGLRASFVLLMLTGLKAEERCGFTTGTRTAARLAMGVAEEGLSLLPGCEALGVSPIARWERTSPSMIPFDLAAVGAVAIATDAAGLTTSHVMLFVMARLASVGGGGVSKAVRGSRWKRRRATGLVPSTEDPLCPLSVRRRGAAC